MSPKVLVVGSGGVGAVAALSLTLNGKCETTLVVRSDHDKVVAEGYTFRSVTYGNFDNWRPVHVARSVADAATHGPFDFIVVTTKNIPDGPMTCEDIIRPAVSLQTTIVLIQNGIGIEGPMIQEFPGNVVLSSVTLIGSTNINCEVHNLHKDTMLLSPFNNPNVSAEIAQQKAREFADLYQNADEKVNKVILEESSLQSRWEKLVYNSVFNTICTIVELDVNRCQIFGSNELFNKAMNEVVAIAASDGVVIDDSTKEKFMHIGDGLFYSPSMTVDRMKKQYFELEVILGNPLRIAREKNVPCPVLETVYQLLKMVQLKMKEEKGAITINQQDYKGVNSEKYPEIFQATLHK